MGDELIHIYHLESFLEMMEIQTLYLLERYATHENLDEAKIF
jgi:hypothetical protein